MAKKISEDTEVKLDLKTIGLLVGGAISLASMWFTLQGEIQELNNKIDNFSSEEFVQKMEFQLKDELVRSTIIQIEKSTEVLKEDILDNKESIKVSMQEPIEYKINIKHNNNDIDFNFRGIHENDVVIISDIISTTHQTTLINLLKLGGKFHFHFEADDENKSVYDFEINDPSNFYFSKLYENLNKS